MESVAFVFIVRLYSADGYEDVARGGPVGEDDQRRSDGGAITIIYRVNG